ncbi:MAG: O-glycosyl hydrolase, family 30, partial [Eubacterium sp.]|nr:O-glycosyl hydrolase, family 30 [Eubacterium sp.]
EAKEIYLDIVSYLENGCISYSYWNMILDESTLSSWGWKQNSMITINRTTKEVLYNYEYYVMLHFSRFVEPGAKRIGSSGSDGGSMIAFKNPDRSIIVLVSNFSDEKRTADICLEQENFKVCLDPSSIYTLRFSRA